MYIYIYIYAHFSAMSSFIGKACSAARAICLGVSATAKMFIISAAKASSESKAFSAMVFSARTAYCLVCRHGACCRDSICCCGRNCGFGHGCCVAGAVFTVFSATMASDLAVSTHLP